MCKKESWISCGIFGFARPVERFGVERYKSNSSKVCCLNTTPVTVNCISCHKKGKHINLSVLDGTQQGLSCDTYGTWDHRHR